MGLVVKWYNESDDEGLLDSGRTNDEIIGLPFEVVPLGGET